MASHHRRSLVVVASALLAACSAAPVAPDVVPTIEPQAAPPTSPPTTPPPPQMAAAPAPAPAGGFTFAIQPYFWFVGSEGNADIGSNGQLHASFGGMFDSMDASFGLRADMGPDSGPYRILFDTNYQSQSNDTRTGSFHAYRSSFESDIAWRPGQRDLFDPLVGLRYTELDAVQLFDASNTAAAESRGWFDPVVGARGRIPLVDRLSLDWRADVGGFGVGSDLSYQLDASATWTFNRMFHAFAGWRYLKVDYSSSTLDYDVAATGPYIGMSFVF
jgi:hypothetical protein